jgi:hypothetical protein
MEILARVERRRKWSIEEKAALIAEIEAEGGKVRRVAAAPDFRKPALQLAFGLEGCGCCGPFAGSGGVRAARRLSRRGQSRTGDVAGAGTATVATAG